MEEGGVVGKVVREIDAVHASMQHGVFLFLLAREVCGGHTHTHTHVHVQDTRLTHPADDAMG